MDQRKIPKTAASVKKPASSTSVDDAGTFTNYSLLSWPWTRKRRGRNHVVEAHVVRQLTIMVSHVESVTEYHCRACQRTWLATRRRDRHLIAEVSVVELREGVFAVLE